MAKHRANKIKNKLYWWQRKHRIEMKLQYWFREYQDLKVEVQEIVYLLKIEAARYKEEWSKNGRQNG